MTTPHTCRKTVTRLGVHVTVSAGPGRPALRVAACCMEEAQRQFQPWLAAEEQRMREEAIERATPPCFRVLGLRGDATEAQIKAAFRRLTRRLHPDAGGTDAAFCELHDAYEQALAHVRQLEPDAA